MGWPPQPSLLRSDQLSRVFSEATLAHVQPPYGVSPIYHLLARISILYVGHSFAASLTSPIFSLGAYFFRTDSLWYYIAKKELAMQNAIRE